MISHQGEIIEKAVRRSGKKLTQIASELGMSRENLYNLFKRQEVPINYMLRLGKIINHDFTEDFPQEFSNILEEPYGEFEALPQRLKRIESERDVFKEKCFQLMEENKLLLANKLEAYFHKYGAIKE